MKHNFWAPPRGSADMQNFSWVNKLREVWIKGLCARFRIMLLP